MSESNLIFSFYSQFFFPFLFFISEIVFMFAEKRFAKFEFRNIKNRIYKVLYAKSMTWGSDFKCKSNRNKSEMNEQREEDDQQQED